MNAIDFARVALLGEAADHLTGVAVFVWDDDRNYVAVNEDACRLVGRTREELLSMRVGDTTADRAEPHFSQVQRSGVHRGTLVIDRPDGGVEVEWLTCRTRVGSLPYMVSMCWQKEPE